MFVLAMILLCMFQLFGGLLIALESLPPWVQWLKYLSFIRYGIEVSFTCVKLVYLGVCGDEYDTVNYLFCNNSIHNCVDYYTHMQCHKQQSQ